MRIKLKAMLWLGALLLGAAACAALITRRAHAAELPFYASADLTPNWKPAVHRVGSFALTDQRGHAFTDKDVAGRVYVASFIYTRCSVTCPALIKSLRKVQDATESRGAMIVSFSVTPDLDTPPVLSAFGKERGIDADRWKLITGDKQQIYALARDSFFADDERVKATVAEPDAFLHTEKLVLVDRQGRLRGVYDGTVPRDVELLIADASALLK